MTSMWWAALSGCTNPAGPGPEAIEITGYLDAGRVAWTQAGAEVLAGGLARAADPGAGVHLVNDLAGAAAETLADDEGGFTVAVVAELGDRVTLHVDGAPDDDDVVHEVDELAPFPDHAHIGAWADTHEADTVVVEVQLEPPREDGRMWVVNRAEATSAVTLTVHEHGAVHQGQIRGAEGDPLLVWFVADIGLGSLPVELVLGPPP